MPKVRWGALASVVTLALLAPPSWAQKAGQVSVDGLSFAHVEAGSGPPVVLVHGSVSDYREWSKQMTPLARRYRVIAYSRRYHWPNQPPGADADAGVERQADDLAAIIKALSLGPAHIVGHSIGGAIALNLALRFPELVRTLVLAEPGVAGVLANTPEDAAATKESQAIRAEMNGLFAAGDAERIVRAYAAHVAPGEYEKAGPEVRRMLIDNVPAFQLDYTSRRPPFTCDEARRISVPVLITAGGSKSDGVAAHRGDGGGMHQGGKIRADTAGNTLDAAGSGRGFQRGGSRVPRTSGKMIGGRWSDRSA